MIYSNPAFAPTRPLTRELAPTAPFATRDRYKTQALSCRNIAFKTYYSGLGGNAIAGRAPKPKRGVVRTLINLFR